MMYFSQGRGIRNLEEAVSSSVSYALGFTWNKPELFFKEFISGYI